MSSHLIWAMRYFIRTSGMFLGLHVINAIQCKFTVPSPGQLGGQLHEEHTSHFEGLKIRDSQELTPMYMEQQFQKLKRNKCSCADQLHS